MTIISAGLYQGRLALDAIDQIAQDLGARMALGGRVMPTSLDVRQAAEELIRASVNVLRQSLDVLDREPSVALLTTALRHLSGAQLTARRMLDAAARLDIPVATVRADLADLLRGKDVGWARYELDRSDLTGLRTVRSDMERLAVDQIYDATHLAQLDHLRAMGVEVAWWVRSSHAIPCPACDDLADGSPYPVDQWPERPHPWCQCMPQPRDPLARREA